MGYVGYPLAEAFSRHVRTIGFDIDPARVAQVRCSCPAISATTDPGDLHRADFILVCVPTPVSKEKEPDLSFIRSAAATIGRNMKKGCTVVLESTVVPGVTEGVIRPILEAESGLACGSGFFIGYSPERINPGDDEHALSRTVKVVAGMDEETPDRLESLYSRITKVRRARNIRTAEATKVVENIQRDVNIALVNEIAIVLRRMGIDTRDVLECAATKWNFHPYQPGIVGGHCIPVVPYFLVARAKETGFTPELILAGRKVNEGMPAYIGSLVKEAIADKGIPLRESRVVVFGLTYKENVPDTRDNPLMDLTRSLKEQGVSVYGADPLLTDGEIERLGLIPLPAGERIADCIVIAAPHAQIAAMRSEDFRMHARPGAAMVDIKGTFRDDAEIRRDFRYITL